MAAANTDLFTKVGTPGTATTLSAPGHSIGDTSITVASTTNWPTTTGAIFAMDQVQLVNGVETRIAGTYTEWEGVVGGGTAIGSMVLKTGTDQNYPAGSTSRVYIPVTSSRENALVDGLLVQHNQDGTHKDAIVTTAMVGDSQITAIKTAPNARRLGGSSFAAPGSDQASGYKLGTLTVTIPGTGNRYIKVSAKASVGQFGTSSNDVMTLTLKEGVATLESGSSFCNGSTGATNNATPALFWEAQPTSGSHTYDLYLSSGVGSRLAINGGRILVELLS